MRPHLAAPAAPGLPGLPRSVERVARRHRSRRHGPASRSAGQPTQTVDEVAADVRHTLGADVARRGRPWLTSGRGSTIGMRSPSDDVVPGQPLPDRVAGVGIPHPHGAVAAGGGRQRPPAGPDANRHRGHPAGVPDQRLPDRSRPCRDPEAHQPPGCCYRPRTEHPSAMPKGPMSHYRERTAGRLSLGFRQLHR